MAEKYIEEIIELFSTEPKGVQTSIFLNINQPENYREIGLSLRQYLYLAIQTFIRMPLEYTNLFQNVYNLAEEMTTSQNTKELHCARFLVGLTEDFQIKLSDIITESYFVHKYNYDDLEIANLFEEIKNSLSTCKYVCIAIENIMTDEHHSNFILLVKKEDNILCYPYEPHGTTSLEPRIVRFIKELKKRTGLNISFQKVKYQDKCPLGIQKYTEDNVGFCLLFSILLFFCFLFVLFKGETNLEILLDIERTLIEKIKEKENITNFMFNFCKTLYVYYMESNINSEGFLDYLNDRFNMNYEIFKKEDYFKKGKYRTDKRENRNSKISKKDTEPDTQRKRDKEECKTHSDCLSDLCINGVCENFEVLYGKTKKSRTQTRTRTRTKNTPY